MTDPLQLLAAFLLAVVGVARATRLLIHDGYPPTAALRRWWWNQTVAKGGWRDSWHLLLVGREPDESGCPFCAAPYIAAVALGTAVWADVLPLDLGTLAGWWWLLAVWASVSYLAAMLVLRDEPPAEHDHA